MHILILETDESDETILQEVCNLLEKRAGFRFTELLQASESNDTLKNQVLSFQDLEIHIKRQSVYKSGKLVPLSHYEFFTLYYLAKHPGWVFSRQQIYEAIWREPDGNADAIITNVISQIRKKLNPEDPKNTCIKTVINSGYKFEIPTL